MHTEIAAPAGPGVTVSLLRISLPVSVFIICVMWFILPSPQARQIGKQAPFECRGKMIKVWWKEGGREGGRTWSSN